MNLKDKFRRNFVITTELGPYPSKPVYDYNTFDLIRIMNQGVEFNDKEFGGQTDFTIACTAMPTSKRIDAGVDFFKRRSSMTQIVP